MQAQAGATMTNKIPVTIEDVARHSVLPYTLFDKDGNIVSYKGVVLTPKLVSLLSTKGLLYKLKPKKEAEERKIANTDLCMVSKISQETTSAVLGITKEFMQLYERGDQPSIQGYYSARDQIFKEVKEHIAQISHIGELRINFDDYNLTHGINVATLSTAIALKLNYNEDVIKDLALCGLLHDIGKLKLPAQVLNKPGTLTPREFEIVKLHAPLGYKIVRDEYNLDVKIASCVLDHQERYDGSGYNRGLIGDKINTMSQIISLADVYDAASSNKVYAQAKSPGMIIKELLKQSKEFNPRLLYTLVHMVDFNTGNVKEAITLN